MTSSSSESTPRSRRTGVVALLVFALIGLGVGVALGYWHRTDEHAAAQLIVLMVFAAGCWIGALVAATGIVRALWQRNLERCAQSAMQFAVFVLLPFGTLIAMAVVSLTSVQPRFPDVNFDRIRTDCLALMGQTKGNSFLRPGDPVVPESVKSLEPHLLYVTAEHVEVMCGPQHFFLVPDGGQAPAHSREIAPGVYFWERDD